VKSATYDEWGHLQNGLALLRGGDDRFPIDLTVLINPPLAKMLAASPIRTENWAGKDIPPQESFSCRAERKSAERRAAFPFNFDVDTIDLLRLSRLPILLFSLLGIPLLFFLSSELGLARAGPWSALVYSFSPNILAHARLVTPDLPVTVLILATVLVWLRLIRAPSLRRSVFAGTVLGLSLATKYSAVILIPILAMAWVAAPRSKRLSAFGWSMVAGIIAGLFVVVIYGAVVLPALGNGPLQGEHGEEVERYAYFMDTWVGRNLAMPIVLYRYGAIVAGRAVMKSFLVGHHRFGGWLSYFPIAICVKTPLAVLMALSLCLGWALKTRRFSDRVLLWIAGFPVLYIAVTLAKGIRLV